MSTTKSTKQFKFILPWIALFALGLTPLNTWGVTINKTGKDYIINNGTVSIKVPAELDGDIPAPIKGIRYNGFWYGSGTFVTKAKLKSFSANPLTDGVQLHYRFEAICGIDTPYLAVAIRARDNTNEVYIEESYRMENGAHYSFNASDNWAPTEISIKHWAWANDALSAINTEGDRTIPITPRARFSKTLDPYRLFYMQPRWTQSADAAYFAEVKTFSNSVGIAVCRAGKWFFPHDSYIHCRTSASGGDVHFDFPTQRGGRYYLLFAGEAGMISQGNRMVDSYQSYTGNPKFYDAAASNPTDQARRQGNRLVEDVKAGKLPKCDAQTVLNYLNPDYWGYPYNLWSPVNPNFWTEQIRIPAMMGCGCTSDPRFAEIKEKVEESLRRHIEYTWVTPGGAGECPGYNVYGFEVLEEFAPLLKQYYGIDVHEWEPIIEAKKHIEEVGKPPIGDTHPPHRWVGNLAETKEYPHFGVLFVDKKDTLVWKAGPMRGHYHGDQLAMHWWGKAIDHQVGYAPKADQEHMHNRVSFAPKDWAFANMDGFERIIAFGKNPLADVSIAQVESNRLRKMPKTPEEAVWQGQYEERALDQTLTYRRTIVMVKGPTTYFVVRDQHWGPDLKATYNLHTTGLKVNWNGSNKIDFGTMSLFVAKPEKLTFEENSYWGRKYGTGYIDPTMGANLTVEGTTSEFITVLWPNSEIPTCSAIQGGVQVGADQITFADPNTYQSNDAIVSVNNTVLLRGADVNLNRSQGYGYLDKGRSKWDGRIFILEGGGASMGQTPEWLLAQRVPGYQPEICEPLQTSLDANPKSEALKQSIRLYPNPTTDKVYISGLKQSHFKAKVSDMLGRIVSNQTLNQPIIDLSGLPSGLYIVAIETPQGWVSAPIMKQ